MSDDISPTPGPYFANGWTVARIDPETDREIDVAHVVCDLNDPESIAEAEATAELLANVWDLRESVAAVDAENARLLEILEDIVRAYTHNVPWSFTVERAVKRAEEMLESARP